MELEPILGHAAGPGIRVELELASELPLCRVDETQFDAAILNLIINARDAVSQGGQVMIETALSEHPTTGAKQINAGRMCWCGSAILARACPRCCGHRIRFT